MNAQINHLISTTILHIKRFVKFYFMPTLNRNYCNLINEFTVTFAQFSDLLLNKNINFIQNKFYKRQIFEKHTWALKM